MKSELECTKNAVNIHFDRHSIIVMLHCTLFCVTETNSMTTFCRNMLWAIRKTFQFTIVIH